MRLNDEPDMRTAHLFAGAGGGLLADLILGHTPVLAVEWDAHACAVLRERSADGWFPGLHVHEGDVRSYDFRPWARRVDCISAGFPCQDISAAGRGAGINGSRSGLVSEVFRAIDEIRPKFVFLENSPIIRTKGRAYVTQELVARGYRWRDGKIGAVDVGAGHQRDRWFLLATNTLRSGKQTRDSYRPRLLGQPPRNAVANSAENAAYLVRCGSQGQWWNSNDCAGQETPAHSVETSAADDLRHRLQIAVQRGGLSGADAITIKAAARYVARHNWSPPDTGVCRVVDGMASRVDRIKCAGNGQVPLQAAAAFLALMES